jgi:hypothetical protein
MEYIRCTRLPRMACRYGVFRDRSRRSLPGPQERGTGDTLGVVFGGVETEATRQRTYTAAKSLNRP